MGALELSCRPPSARSEPSRAFPTHVQRGPSGLHTTLGVQQRQPRLVRSAPGCPDLLWLLSQPLPGPCGAEVATLKRDEAPEGTRIGLGWISSEVLSG